MAAEYKVRVYSASGALQYELIDYTALAYTKAVNEPGMALITLGGLHPVVGTIGLDWQVEIYRRDIAYGVEWYCDFYGLFRDSERRADQNGVQSATLYCPGQMSLLGRAIVAYPAATDGRTHFTGDKAETIAKALVTYNATASGTTGDGRKRSVTLDGITVESDGEAGATLDWDCAWDNLLSSLQSLALAGDGDFDLVKTGGATWEFRWHDGQLGSDHSATVTFSLAHGNMANPTLRRNTLEERTVVIAGGQGEEAARVIVVATGENYEAAHNATEYFHPALDFSTTDGLGAAAAAQLRKLQGRAALSFDVIQIPSTVYGRDYALGDLVTATFAEYSAVKKVSAVSVEFGTGGEKLSVEMADA